jgi:hypothetical protein
MILSIGFLILSAVFWLQFEMIIRKDKQRIWFPSWNWWVDGNWDTLWYWKYVLPMFTDGRHFCKYLGVVFACLSLLNTPWLSLALYLAFWLITEASYLIKWRNL